MANRKKEVRVSRETALARARMGQVLFNEKEVKAILGRVPKDLVNCALAGPPRKLFRVLEVMNHVKVKKGEWVRSNGEPARRVLLPNDDQRTVEGAGQAGALLDPVSGEPEAVYKKARRSRSSRIEGVFMARRRVAKNRAGGKRRQSQPRVAKGKLVRSAAKAGQGSKKLITAEKA